MISCLLVVCLAGGLPFWIADDAAKADPLDGTWKLQQVEWAQGSARVSVVPSAKVLLIIDGAKLTRRTNDGTQVKTTPYLLFVDDDQKPARYQQMVLAGRWTGTSTTGIYRLSGDTLILCMSETAVPKNFSLGVAQEPADKRLYTYRRESK